MCMNFRYPALIGHGASGRKVFWAITCLGGKRRCRVARPIHKQHGGMVVEILGFCLHTITRNCDFDPQERMRASLGSYTNLLMYFKLVNLRACGLLATKVSIS